MDLFGPFRIDLTDRDSLRTTVLAKTGLFGIWPLSTVPCHLSRLGTRGPCRSLFGVTYGISWSNFNFSVFF